MEICETKISRIKRPGNKKIIVTVKVYENGEQKDLEIETSNPYKINDEVYVVRYKECGNDMEIYKVKDFV